jgi:hypothetical protein
MGIETDGDFFYHRGNAERMEEYGEHTEGTGDPPNLPKGRLNTKSTRDGFYHREMQREWRNTGRTQRE